MDLFPMSHVPSEPVHPAPAQPPQVIIQNSGGTLAWRVLAGIAWVGLFFCMIIIVGQALAYSQYFNTREGVSEKFHSGSETASNKIAIINVTGVIMSGEGYIRNQIDMAQEDDDVKAIVVRVDSPGGTVTGSDYILHHLNRVRTERDIPLVVSMGGAATSGGYYVAMAVGDQEDSIFAEPTTTTGSIGVIIPHYDISGLMAKYDIEDDSIMSHPRKQMLAMTRDMPEEHREILQDYVNQAFTRFKDIIKEGRPAFRQNPEKLDELATGEIFTATTAVSTGLVDKIGFLEEAIKRAAEMADIDPEKTRVVEYTRPSSIFNIASANKQAMSWEKMVEMTTPKAYYLQSYFPPALMGLRLDPRQ